MELCEYNPQHRWRESPPTHRCPSDKDNQNTGSTGSYELLEPAHASLVMESFLELLSHFKPHLCKELASVDTGQLVNPQDIAQAP